MDSLLKSTRNTRSILPDSFRFVRSDVPDRLTEGEIQWLLQHRITTVVDLRTREERQRRPCALEEDPRFCCHWMQVKGGDTVPDSEDGVCASYIAMADAQMEKIIQLICTAASNVLYFCNAGKDRTGVVSAILLLKAGMDREYILEDYMRSKENLMPLLEAYARQFPNTDIWIITPKRRYMEEFLDWYETRK